MTRRSITFFWAFLLAVILHALIIGGFLYERYRQHEMASSYLGSINSKIGSSDSISKFSQPPVPIEIIKINTNQGDALQIIQAREQAKAQAIAEAKAKAEALAKAKAEEEAKIKAEAIAKARAEMEAKARAEAKAKAEEEAGAKAVALAAAQAIAQAKQEEEARLKAQEEAKAQAIAQAEATKKRIEADRIAAEAIAKAKAFAQAQARAYKEAQALLAPPPQPKTPTKPQQKLASPTSSTANINPNNGGGTNSNTTQIASNITLFKSRVQNLILSNYNVNIITGRSCKIIINISPDGTITSKYVKQGYDPNSLACIQGINAINFTYKVPTPNPEIYNLVKQLELVFEAKSKR